MALLWNKPLPLSALTLPLLQQFAAPAALRFASTAKGKKVVPKAKTSSKPSKNAAAGSKQAKKATTGSNKSLFRKFIDCQYDSTVKSDAQKEHDATVAKEYSKQMMAVLRKRDAEEDLKIKLKWAAIEALPESLRAEAIKVEDAIFPMERWIVTDTPPLPDMLRSRNTSSVYLDDR